MASQAVRPNALACCAEMQKALTDGEFGGLSNYHRVMEFVLLLTLRTLKAAYVNIVAHLLIDVNKY